MVIRSMGFVSPCRGPVQAVRLFSAGRRSPRSPGRRWFPARFSVSAATAALDRGDVLLEMIDTAPVCRSSPRRCPVYAAEAVGGLGLRGGFARLR